jgi:hypothetical protein
LFCMFSLFCYKRIYQDKIVWGTSDLNLWMTFNVCGQVAERRMYLTFLTYYLHSQSWRWNWKECFQCGMREVC